jgi:hypothetical protein
VDCTLEFSFIPVYAGKVCKGDGVVRIQFGRLFEHQPRRFEPAELAE